VGSRVPRAPSANCRTPAALAEPVHRACEHQTKSRDHRHLSSLTASGVSTAVDAIMVTIWIHGKVSPPNGPYVITCEAAPSGVTRPIW
jgi:hypothetical protein